ncbi:hypothetical protein [Streptomyces sp. NRRL F-5123]|uniref:hypothetical protein n=1 Tax=Streptomyces sp. NRRL F-5123 TaxID=1463856 RepID=UPI001F3C3506|nr:hypothetical protein [Streptomyces sp. NRRL F-5123]
MWTCAPRWESGAVFSALVGGRGRVRPDAVRPVRGRHPLPGSRRPVRPAPLGSSPPV